MDITTIALIAFGLVILGLGIMIYNKLVALKHLFENAFAQIDVQLKRRYDLIPNLVETAKGYMTHEKATLEAVTHARNDALTTLQNASASPSVETISKLAGAESLLQGALGQLKITMEAYPDLMASENMLKLSEEISTTENRVAFARQAFNDAVMAYNIYRQSFPTILVAGFFGHTQNAMLLDFADSAVIQTAPSVSFK